MFVPGLRRLRRASDTKISSEKKLHMLKRTGEDGKKEETCANFKFSEVKQNLNSIVSFVDSNPQCNEYYLTLVEMRKDVVKEQYKRGTQTKISSFYKHCINNTK
jgi:hypothetical protein